MQFALSEEHALLADMVRGFARDALAPHAGAWDRAGALPPELWSTLAGLGLTGICVPEKLGGAGMDMLALTVVIEEVARVSGSVAWILAVHNALAIGHLRRVGASDVVRALAGGALIGGWAAGMRARPIDGGWRLEGRLEGVTFDPARGALVVVAETLQGPTAFLATADAVRFERTPSLGVAAASVGAVEVSGPARMVGAPGAGARDIGGLREAAAPVWAALGVGLGSGAMEAAVGYARERAQFGRPIAEFQAIQWMIADAFTELEAARLQLRRAAITGEPADALAARSFAAPAAVRAADRAIQMHGGYGYTREYPVERFWRDAQRLLVGLDADRSALAAAVVG